MARGRDALNSPARLMAVVTPNDSADLPNGECQGLYVGGTGNITLVSPVGGANVLISAIPVGTILPVSTARINATATTATLIVALYSDKR